MSLAARGDQHKYVVRGIGKFRRENRRVALWFYFRANILVKLCSSNTLLMTVLFLF